MKRITLTAVLLAASSPPALANSVKTDERGITLEAGDIELNLSGRVHFDAVVFDNPATGATGETKVDFRRARLELSGKIGPSVRFRIDREFAGHAKGWRNVWASFRPVEAVEVKGGNFTVPFSMEDLQSSNTMTFAERSLASALTPGYGLGGSVSATGSHWTISTGYFGKALANDAGYAPERGHGFAARTTFLPLRDGRTKIHVALGFESRSFGAGRVIRFSADPGSSFAPTLMSSYKIRDIDHMTSWNGELAGNLGPVLIQAQLVNTKISRVTLPDLSFSGQTLQAGWMVTGERYDYVKRVGIFDGPKLRDRHMALEVAARYSRLGLDDGPVARGVGRAISAGANLYINRNVRMMVTYTDSHVDFPGIATGVNNSVGVSRLQINF
jgi:phosphate-selective porin OprO/OprP